MVVALVVLSVMLLGWAPSAGAFANRGGGMASSNSCTASGNPITVSLVPTSAQVGGTSVAVTITETSSGNPVDGDTITVTNADTGVSVPAPDSGAGTGTYTATIATGNDAGTWAITATDSTSSSVGCGTLTQTPGPAASISVSLGSPSIPVGTTTTATATVTDSFGNAVANEPVAISSSGSQGLSPTSGTTDSAGQFASTVTATHTPGTFTITVTDTNNASVTGTATLTQTPGPAASITVSLNPPSIAVGGASSTATATAKDQFGNVVPGVPVQISSSGSQGLSPSTGTTNSSGVFTSTITSTNTAGTSTITVTDTSNTSVKGTATLTQTAGSATNISVVLGSPSIAVGGATTTATATVTDSHGNPVGGDSVTISSPGGQGFSPSTGTTTSSGVFTSTLTSSNTAGTYTISVTDGSVTGTATLTQTPGPAATVAVSLNPSSIPANGTATSTITATVTDAFGNPRNGDSVVVTASGGQAIASASGTTTLSGVFTTTLTGTTAVGASTITVTDQTSPASGTAQLQQGLATPFQMGMTLGASSLLADSSSQTSVTIHVADAAGHPIQGDTITLSDPSVSIATPTGTTDVNGNFTSTVTSSLTPGTSTLSATDSTSGLSAATTLTLTPWLANSIGLALSPSTITANGSSSTTATITLTDALGRPRFADSALTLSASDPHVHIGALVDHGDGTYSAAVTSSTTPGTVQLQAKDGMTGLVASAALQQVHGPAASVTVALSRPLITADGLSTTIATATVRDASGNPVAGNAIHLTTTNRGVHIGPVTDHGNGTYTAVLTSSNQPATLSVIATDTSVGPPISGEASLTEILAPSLAGIVTMQWRFLYTPDYTKVLALALAGAPRGGQVVALCHGSGCPRHGRKAIALASSCHGSKSKCKLTPGRSILQWLSGHRLRPKARLIIEVTRKGWIGKYYAFTVRRATGPLVTISCLAPDGTSPGVGCR